MKNKTLYIILGVVVVATLVLFFTSQHNKEKKLDERLSFRKRDKVPYGTRVAFESLKDLFPNAVVASERREPGRWDTLSPYVADQALLIVSPVFMADDYEMNELLEFVKRGNQVFISAVKLSEPVETKLRCSSVYTEVLELWGFLGEEEDTLSVSLLPPLAPSKTDYNYPGKKMDTWLSKLDTNTTQILGYNSKGKANLVRLSAGKGNIFLHLAPMSLTNYFLLHKNNLAYYEQLMSVIPAATKKIVWDEYFISKRSSNPNDDKKGWMSVFMKHQSLRLALLTALLALLVYVLMEMRRKQRQIPVIKPPKNDSLDFVKTIGRLYYDKGDHRNLARKMTAYFLEHVRNRYKISTAALDDNFVKALQHKSGVPETEIMSLVYSINKIEELPAVNDKLLSELHKQLESFYKKA